MSRRVLPIDLVIAAYNIVLACVWIPMTARTPVAGWIAAAHIAAATLPWILLRAPDRLPGPIAAVREAYPLTGLLVFWSELGLLQHIRRLPTHDHLVAAWDQALFGIHLHAAWMPAMPARWLSETMYGSYLLYYALLVLPPLVVGLSRRLDAFRDMVFRLMTAYLTCYLFYIAFPVYGPQWAAPGHAAPLAAGFFRFLVERAREAGDSLGTAFPSSHAAGAVTVAWIGCRTFSRRIGALLVLQACAVLLATVYTQNHFAIDALVGAIWAILAQALLVPALARALGRSAAARATGALLPTPARSSLARAGAP